MSQPTIFDRINFPQYQYREYPKMVYPGPVYGAEAPEPHLVGKPIGQTVYSQEEEVAVMGAIERGEAGESVGLDALRSEAESLGVSVDLRWGMTRLRKEIADAEMRRGDA